jgi:bifunctional non-homologous end joining protein LigD
MKKGVPAMSLEEYRAKRDFRTTLEPAPVSQTDEAHALPIFVIQEHHASRLHYDFRLGADGVLKSWAVPKEPSIDPAQKRLAVRVEDHPLAYARFEGTIPEGQYGAGRVKIWDHGTYENLLAEKPIPLSVTEGIEAGRLEFVLHGRKLRGKFALIRLGSKGRGKENWLLIKMKDEFARPGVQNDERLVGKPESIRRRKAANSSRGAPRESGRPQKLPTLTHPDKVLFPDAGITKRDVFEFYRRIAPRLLPHLRDRPATLERLPEGLGDSKAPHFWQKNTPAYYPEWIERIELPSERGKSVHYVLINDLATLLYLVNQGTLTFHVWLSRTVNLDLPDYVLFDLDPGQASFGDAVAVAQRLNDILTTADRKSFLKTSGKTGLHVLTPWMDEGGYEEARGWASGIAEKVVEALPNQATVERSKAKRGRRVYVDVMQNAKGHHVVSPYVLRALPGAPVSTPLRWSELTLDLEPAQFNIETIFRRLARQKSDPMAGLVRAFAGRRSTLAQGR